MERSGQLHYGKSAVPADGRPASGHLVHAFGEDCYVIEDAQTLAPFLTTVVSDGDLWLFAVSNGGVTAGRRSPASALFPYVTEDKLADSAGTAGGWTSLVATRGGVRSLWCPLAASDRLVYRLRRRLYKSVFGTRLVFEEENEDLGLVFRAGWSTSDRYGFVRECTLENRGPGPVAVRVLDGLVGILPGNADERLQLEFSSLLDAYKQAERLAASTLAVFTLAAQPVDRPEPREALHATTVWSHGLPDARIALSASAREAFAQGASLPAAELVRGQRGAYLVEAGLELAAGAEHGWAVIADVARTQADVAALRKELREPAALVSAVRADVARGVARITELLASTDGQQLGADPTLTAHHQSNVLFNDLRGGVYAHGTGIPGRDFEVFVHASNRLVTARHGALLAALPELESREAHAARIEAVGDPDLARLSAEYLPLCFSRRHGDPSRPWNRFDIQVRDAQGAPVLDYQGNWRDIFQNWEALSRSFPGFAEQIVAKFVNASTADGHNPYRIGRGGIDWETPDPHHPWNTIGYWGDHQLVYLERLLALSLRHHPSALPAWLEQRRFTYADVPYEYRPWADIVADPRNTIRFDAARHARIEERARVLGSDARLLHGQDGLVRVTLLEKLLVPALAKLANFVPGGGVWMNTQRPEWNDANNALVGHGVSMVTLCHLDRYLETLAGILAPLSGRTTGISREVAAWLAAALEALRTHRPTLDRAATEDGPRAAVMDALGMPASSYRAGVYRAGLSAPTPVRVEALEELVGLAREYARHTIARARRPDGLLHAYNVLVPRGAGAGFGIQHLEEMLEGQVAALGTSAVDDETALGVLTALRASRLFRSDQRSYTLYPDRRLPGFLEKNVVPEAALDRAPLLGRMLAAGDRRVVLRDAAGDLRFEAGLVNAEACAAALAAVREAGSAVTDEEAAGILKVYEEVFHHRAFTGRSGTMFAYEGLGSIYWHMVGKLLLAVQERFVEAAERGAPAELLGRYAGHYEEIRAGMGGAEKSPAVWGAFPLDAYSHNPAGAGARQPGMTGQVKEEILIRFGELGVVIRGGRIAFRPRLLRRSELLAGPAIWEPLGVDGERIRLELASGSLGFTLAQVPVVYRLAERSSLAVVEAGGSRTVIEGDTLDEARSAAVFARTGRIRWIEVFTRPGR